MVQREGVDGELECQVKREKVEVPTVEYQLLEGYVGLIQIAEFSDLTPTQFESAVTELKSQGMTALIVDVRDNPGGVLDAVCDVLDQILPEGLLVYTEDKYGEREEYNASGQSYLEMPLAVRVNGNSASAAEIYTAAMQDYGVAEIVGTKTFGKGIVQTIITLSDQKTALKITTARYYTPNGVCIHGEGIEPDDVVELDEGLATKAVISKDEDNQFQEGLRILKEKMD